MKFNTFEIIASPLPQVPVRNALRTGILFYAQLTATCLTLPKTMPDNFKKITFAVYSPFSLANIILA